MNAKRWARRIVIVVAAVVVLAIAIGCDCGGYAIGYWHGSQGDIWDHWCESGDWIDTDRPAMHRGWVAGYHVFAAMVLREDSNTADGQ